MAQDEQLDMENGWAAGTKLNLRKVTSALTQPAPVVGYTRGRVGNSCSFLRREFPATNALSCRRPRTVAQLHVARYDLIGCLETRSDSPTAPASPRRMVGRVGVLASARSDYAPRYMGLICAEDGGQTHR